MDVEGLEYEAARTNALIECRMGHPMKVDPSSGEKVMDLEAFEAFLELFVPKEIQTEFVEKLSSALGESYFSSEGLNKRGSEWPTPTDNGVEG